VPLLLGTVSEEAWPFIFQASSKPLSESLYVLFNAYLFNIDMVSVRKRALHNTLHDRSRTSPAARPSFFTS
jgi:hypothetical protein